MNLSISFFFVFLFIFSFQASKRTALARFGLGGLPKDASKKLQIETCKRFSAAYDATAER